MTSLGQSRGQAGNVYAAPQKIARPIPMHHELADIRAASICAWITITAQEDTPAAGAEPATANGALAVLPLTMIRHLLHVPSAQGCHGCTLLRLQSTSTKSPQSSGHSGRNIKQLRHPGKQLGTQRSGCLGGWVSSLPVMDCCWVAAWRCQGLAKAFDYCLRPQAAGAVSC